MFKVRLAKSDDVNFIYSTWLRCYKHDSPLTKYTKREVFFEAHQKLLDQILTKKEIKVAVAVSKDDDDLIFGFLAYEPNIIHFVYVKEPFRKEGIARKLVESQGIDPNQCKASHLTYSLLDLWTAKKITTEFDPYVLGVK